MTAETLDLYGKLTAPDTLRIERLLPGPIDRVWAYLTQSDLRRKWLAAGDMPLTKGAEFQLTWRNDDLTTPAGKRPEGFGAEHTMTNRILEATPPTRLAFTFGTASEVAIDLAPEGDKVRLTLVHRKIADQGMVLMVGPGWHAHLDVLQAQLGGPKTAPFWDMWQKLKAEYESRIPV